MLWKSDENYKWIHYGEFDGETLQFNDCIAGPDGSFYAGTFFDSSIEGKEKLGKLYRFFPSGQIEIVSENHGCSNGMGFSPDLDWFYHIDAAKKIIYRHPYDKNSHNIGEASIWFHYEGQGGTDGMTIDSEGFIWSAIWGGSCVIRIDPSGKLERKIDVPAIQTSSLMFGGKELKDIYITTAASPQSKHAYPSNSYLGGSLFVEKQLIQGKSEFESNFSWD
jgi:D-xylonolactonase